MVADDGKLAPIESSTAPRRLVGEVHETSIRRILGALVIDDDVTDRIDASMFQRLDQRHQLALVAVM